MAELNDAADPQFVAEQYRDAANLNARIVLHQRFSTNKYGWQSWIFDQLDLPSNSQILELGCGTGNLWRENLDRIATGWDITLSDLSAGMLRQARENLSGVQRSLRFSVVDAQSLPFKTESLDGIVANHMLYHVPDRAAALAEIHRVLKPSGIFYTSTIGERHLAEIRDLISRFDGEVGMWGQRPFASFTLETGADQLERWFPHVSLTRYEDGLIVTQPDALIDYVLSGKMAPGPDERAAFALFVREEFRKQDNRFYVTKDSGMFECRTGGA